MRDGLRHHRALRAARACAALLALAPVSGRAFDVDTLCTGDPCVISDFHPIVTPDATVVLDFGDRDVVITNNAGVAIFEEDADPELPLPPDMEVNARGLSMLAGSTLRSEGGYITITLTGDAALLGEIRSRGQGGEYGGTVTIGTPGNVLLEGEIILIGGEEFEDFSGDGGSLEIDAGGSIMMDAGNGVAIDVSGGTGNPEDGGGSGGDVELNAAGILQLTSGKIRSIGHNDGDGEDVELTAAGQVDVQNVFELEGGPDNGFFGNVDVKGDAAITLDTTLDCRTLLARTSGSVGIQAPLRCQFVTVEAGGDVDVAAGGGVDSETLNGNGGGTVRFTSGGAVTVGADVLATGPVTGGSVEMTGCSVAIAAPATVDAGGATGGAVTLGGLITVAGDVLALPAGTITFVSAASDPPVIDPGATVAPAAADVVDDSIVNCCGAVCDDFDQCTLDRCIPGTGCVNGGGGATHLLCPSSCQTAPPGAPCEDGDACTAGDGCQAGVCVGGSPIVCTPLDQCHAAGTCDPGTGACSNPPLGDGTGCDDGDACTAGEACQAGACTGGSPVVCTPLDQCHAAGTCDPGTGVCSDPPLGDGTGCDDGNACTTGDACQAGACTGGSPIVCTPLDQCHAAGTCDPGTGVCSDPPQADGTSCDDGLYCTVSDACSGGVCGGAPRVCTGCNPRVCNEATDACEPVP